MVEVLAVDADEERGEEEQRRDHGEPLHDLVLLLADLRLVVVAGGGDQVAGDVERLRRAQEPVGRLGEVELERTVEHRVLADVDPAVDDPADRVAGRGERPPNLEHVAPELGQPLANLLAGPVLDPVLELVDLGVEQVDDAEVPLRDLVDEVVRDHARGGASVCVACLLERCEVEGLLARRRLPHRDRHLGREHEIDLLVEDAILLGHGDRGEQHAEDVVAVRLDRRPWVLVGASLARRAARSRAGGAATGVSASSSSREGSSRSIQRAAGLTGPRVAAASAGAYAGAVCSRGAVSAASGWPSASARNRSASSAAAQPEPAAVTAWR